MKWVFDERLKNRLVGLVVVLSLGLIFTPVLVKKQQRHLSGTKTIAIQLPPKPILPKLSIPNEETMFKTVHIAHVNVEEEAMPLQIDTQFDSVSGVNDVKVATVNVAKEVASSKKTLLVKKPMHSPETHTVTPTKPPRVVFVKQTQPMVHAHVTKKASSINPASYLTRYSVQLATFTHQANALSLVNRLKAKGYHAFFQTIAQSKGRVYKVFVGKVDKKQEAERLQQQIALKTQLKGFIVPTTGVS